MDLPNDKLHHLDWHQDRSYYFQNRDGNKDCMLDTFVRFKKKMGLYKFVASHKDGFVSKYKSLEKVKIFYQRKVKLINIEYFQSLKEGDVIFMNKNTIHSSGKIFQI